MLLNDPIQTRQVNDLRAMLMLKLEETVAMEVLPSEEQRIQLRLLFLDMFETAVDAGYKIPKD